MHELCYGQINCQLINRRNSIGNRFGLESGSSTFNDCSVLLCRRQANGPRIMQECHLLSAATDGILLLAVKAPSLAVTGHAPSSPLVGAVAESDHARTGSLRMDSLFPGDLASVAGARGQVMQFLCQHCADEGDQIDILVAS